MTQSTPKLKNLIVDMQPVGRRIEIEAGTSLLEASQAAGVGLVSLCGGEGWCESCLVRIASGERIHRRNQRKIILARNR